jgi:arginyl-tRNA synthetase
MNVLEFLRRQFEVSLARMTDRSADFARLVRPAQDPRFGDYQANCAMPLRQLLGGKSPAIAEQIVEGLPDRTIFASIEIAGPGFINLRLADDFISRELCARITDPKIGLELIGQDRTILIDFSSPNVAKPMHVGHLRSTILGDALARIYRALGWTVVTDNHLGDWGTQFGMLIFGWRRLRNPSESAERPVDELCRLYQAVHDMAENDPEVARRARLETARLHEGDPDNLALWQQFMPHCLEDLSRIYRRLDIKFDHQLGESFYQPLLAQTVAELRSAGIAVESQNAVCVFFPSGTTDAEGNPKFDLPPAIIQKADGAFTYATSDLACIRYRVNQFRPQVIVYVVDDRQALHFQQLFRTARYWGFQNVELVHVSFGKILNKDGTPFKTRLGGAVGLTVLLDEAVSRAQAVVDATAPELPADERRQIAQVVGIGAVKYADLSQNRTSDYVFDWDKMISLDGNTAAYLQYVYARNRSIFRKGGISPSALGPPPAVVLSHPSERTLAVDLIRFPEAVALAADEYKPNALTNYLFELANHYNDLYRDCPVLNPGDASLRHSRLSLCELTARTIKQGLALLGIETVERM